MESVHQTINYHSENTLLETINSAWHSLEIPWWFQMLLFIIFVFIYERQLTRLWKFVNEIKSTAFLITVLLNIVKTIIGVILLIISLPLVLPIYIILIFIKKLVMTFLYHRYGEAISEVSGYDMFFAVCDDDNVNPLINALAKFEGEANLHEYKEHLENIIYSKLENGTQPFRKFRQLLLHRYGYYIWKDDENFCIHNHFKFVDLIETYGNKDDLVNDINSKSSYSDNKLVSKYLNDNGAKPFLDRYPKWEIVFLTYGNAREFTILFRLHHAIGDGIALLRMLLETLSDTPTKISLLGPPSNPLVKFFAQLWSIAFIPFGIFLIFVGSKNPLHGGILTGNSIYVTSKPIHLSLVKRIKEKTKTSVTDVLFSCLSSSLAEVYKKRETEVPEVGILFPIGFEDLSVPVTLTNKFSMGITTLPTPSVDKLFKKEIDHNKKQMFPNLQRLKLINNAFRKAMKDPRIFSLTWILDVVSSFPVFLCKIFASTEGKTMVVSNVPGPPHEVSILKRKMKEIWFFLPNIPPTGISFGFLSYNGFLRVSFHVDRGLIPNEEDVEKIAENYINAFYNLKDEVELL